MISRRAWLVAAAAAVGTAGCGLPPRPTPIAPQTTPTTAATPIPTDGGPAAAGPLFGLNVPYAAEEAVSGLAGRLGSRPALLNRFVKLDSTFTNGHLAQTAAFGRRPMVTIEPWSHLLRSGDVDQPRFSLGAVVRGEHDEALARIGQVLASHDGVVYVRFAHEMNADWYPWAASVNQNTAQDYVAAWRHTFTLMSSLAPNTRWVWAPVAAWWSNPAPLAPLFPGDAYVHFVGATGYGRGPDAETTFGAWWQEVRTLTSRPAFLAETGAAGPDKSRWMASLAGLLRRHPDIEAFVWFNTSPATTGATGDYRFDDTEVNLQAFRDFLAAIDATCG